MVTHIAKAAKQKSFLNGILHHSDQTLRTTKHRKFSADKINFFFLRSNDF